MGANPFLSSEFEASKRVMYNEIHKHLSQEADKVRLATSKHIQDLHALDGGIPRRDFATQTQSWDDVMKAHR